MSSKIQDVRVYPGDGSDKFKLLERTIDTGGVLAFAEAAPYILNATGNNANGVDVTKWHSVTVVHVAQDYSQANWDGCSITFIPWRYYKPLTPQAAAAPPAVNIPPQGAWIADTEETIAIDAVGLGITQQKVYSTLNCDRMFFQITSSLTTAEEAAAVGVEVFRQAVIGVTPRQDDGYSPTVVGAAGGGGGGSASVTIPSPIDTNTIQLAGNAIDLGAGNVGAGTQLVTIADDDTNLSAINTATTAIEVDTTAIAGDTANILLDTTAILADTANIDISTAAIAVSTAIMDDWDAVHDSPAGTDGVRLEGYGTDAQVAAVSANGDDVRLALSRHGESYLASHTYPTQSDRSEEIDPANQWYEFSTVAAVTNGTDATYSYYIPMAGYTRLDAQLTLNGGSGTVTVTVLGSIQADGTAPASLVYQDVTNQAYGVASFTASTMLVDNAKFFNSFNYVQIKVVALTGDNTADWTIYIKKTWE